MSPYSLETATCLMPQHVPGARATDAYRRVEMLPASGTQGSLITIDGQQRLRLWINNEAGTTRWVCIDPFEGSDAPQVIDLAVEQNVTQGRLDGTIDLMLITRSEPSPGAAEHRWFVWHGLPAAADAPAWRALFANARPQDTHGLRPEAAHWGQAPRPWRSRLLQGRDADGRLRLLWQRFDEHGAALHDALEPPLPGPHAPSQAELACTVDRASGGMRREGYARHLAFEGGPGPRVGHLDLIWPAQEGEPRAEQALVALNGSLAGWDTGEGLWPLTLTGSGSTTQVYFDSTRGQQGVIHASLAAPSVQALASTVPGAPVPGRVQALRWRTDDDRVLRFDLVTRTPGAAADLRLTDSRDFAGLDRGRSTLLSDSVAAFSACVCRAPQGLLEVLHLAVVHDQGGIELLSQDSLSGLWQRAILADDDAAGAIHPVSTHTTTLRVLDASRAPVPNARIRVSVGLPCHAYVGGRSLHLSPLQPTELGTDALGECRIAQIVSGLAASQLAIELALPSTPAGAISVNPMQPLAERLRAIGSGAALKQVEGFDGRRPFAGVDLARCEATHRRLQPLLAAYDHTLALANPSAAAPDRANRSEPGPIGDMIAFLWSQGADPASYAIERLADGGYRLSMTLGERLWQGLIELPQHAMALIDHTVQSGLGVDLEAVTNWLGQVFNWDEILSTQATLRRLMALLHRQARDWMANTAASGIEAHRVWARETLTRLPALDPKTRARLARGMTQGPGPQAYAADARGPAAGWGQASLQDHAAAAQLGGAGDWSFAPDVLERLQALGGELSPVLENLKAALAGIDPATQSLLTVFEDTIALSGATVIDAAARAATALTDATASCIDGVWAMLQQRLDIPVLTPLYEQHLVPGSSASLLDLVLLATAITGDVGSRALHRQPLFSPAFAEAVARAGSLTDLLAEPRGRAGTTPWWATDVQLAVTLLAGSLKLVYFICWLELRQMPPGTPFNAGLVRLKCGCDIGAWLVSVAWATARCATRLQPSDALLAPATFLLVDGVFARGKDAAELLWAGDGHGIPAEWTGPLALVEGLAGGVLLAATAIWGSVSAALMPHEQPSDDSNWGFLVAMPALQSIGTSAHYLLGFAEFFQAGVPALRPARNIVNGVRSSLPLLSAIGLGVAARNDWRVPGTISN